MIPLINIIDLAVAIEKGVSLDVDMMDDFGGTYVEEQHIDSEAALDLAHHVLNFFGYSNRIIDNVLEPEDRDAFYMLEDADILYTEREEITLYDGREWRIHYWCINHEKINGIISDEVQAQPKSQQPDIYYSLYHNREKIPDSVWARSQRKP